MFDCGVCDVAVVFDQADAIRFDAIQTGGSVSELAEVMPGSQPVVVAKVDSEKRFIWF